MKQASYLEVPDQLMWLEVIGIEPLNAIPKDGYWCYELSHIDPLILQISFNIFERSLQTVIRFHDRAIQTVVQEGLTMLRLVEENGRRIEGRCVFDNAISSLLITLDPVVEVTWSTLRVI